MTVGACKRQNIQALMSNDEQMKCVSPSSRRPATCASRRRLQLPQILIGGFLGQSRSTVERLHTHGHVQAEQLRLLVLVDLLRVFVSSTEIPSKENGHDRTRKHLMLQLKMSIVALCVHPKVAVELLRKSSRLHDRIEHSRCKGVSFELQFSSSDVTPSSFEAATCSSFAVLTSSSDHGQGLKRSSNTNYASVRLC